MHKYGFYPDFLQDTTESNFAGSRERMKKLMILGGSRYALPVIKAAHNLGCYVITCDYLPNNFAHKFSDEYCNVSIVDKKAVLDAARQLKINGIMSFGCDPGVVTAAYTAEKMGLFSVGSYEAVSILQNKGKFRKFLTDHGFNAPTAKSYRSIEQAIDEISLFRWPVIVKPTDSAGSKGVTRVDSPESLRESIETALSFSRSKEFIIEDFLQQKGFSSDSDSSSLNGEFSFISFNSQRFDLKAENQYTPAAYSWPASISDTNQTELSNELQRLISLLELKTSLYNIEVRECTDGKPYIMECSPRGGGNRLSEMVRYVNGIDMITNAVKAALGEECANFETKPDVGAWAIIILHSNKPGIFEELWISDEIRAFIIERDLWIKPGAMIGAFSAANQTIGTIILRTDTQEKLEEIMSNQEQYIRVKVKND